MSTLIKKLVLHGFILFVVVGIVFYWSQSVNLSPYTLQLVSFLVIIYITLQFLFRKKILSLKDKPVVDVITLTAISYLLVFSTGALFSPVFFILYFLLFGIALLFEPVAAYVLAVVSTIFFLATPSKELMAEILQLSSLFLIAPLAQIFGSQYSKILQSNITIDTLTKEGQECEREVESQEMEVKRWTEQDFKKKLIKIWEEIDALAGDPETNLKQKQKLADISKELGKLLASGEKMKEKIEE